MNRIAQFLAGIVANLLQRTYGSKPNAMLTLAGIISAIAAGLAAFPATVLPAKYEPWLITAAGFFGALAGILGHGQNASLPPPQSDGKQVDAQ